MDKTIYHYDFNGRFLFKGQGELDQIEGKLIIPAFATTIKPPRCGGIYTPYFIDGVWQKVFEAPETPEEPTPEVELSYKEKRQMEYPSFLEYLDGFVKSQSENTEIKEEGEVQLKKYVADCLAVKAKYPKTENLE